MLIVHAVSERLCNMLDQQQSPQAIFIWNPSSDNSLLHCLQPHLILPPLIHNVWDTNVSAWVAPGNDQASFTWGSNRQNKSPY